MRDLISDNALLVFSETFYEALSLGKDIKEAYNLGINAIELNNILEEDIPILFLKQN